ncbi:poly(ADP-ribose) glycohydrolase-like isoform X2 [Plodia interpunctella]|nr:poly(ADP-ribose) glycohydrolase-like isoform X2 [Plodia interpunctella]XP_053612341.1 poly(ADP-ribose) glycohydrolase-like isoform X2 [Plodia interpunctella]
MESSSSTGKSETWRGVPMTEILGAQSPWTAPEFPLVSPSYNHSVLYHVPSNGTVSTDTPPKPQIGTEKWDHGFVRMPFSSSSLYPVVDENGETQLKKRWPMIQEALRKPIRNSSDLANAILSYNSRNKWSFRSLHKLFQQLEAEESQVFFDVTLPEIIKLALALPKLIRAPIPLLRHHKNYSISLSQQQIASLLANAFLCTFPRRNSNKKSTKEYTYFPNINFSSLYEASSMNCVLEKLKCLCHYFRRVCSQVPVGVLTFTRRHVPQDRHPHWATSRRQLAAIPIHVDSGTTIEEAYGLIQFDFANKYIGGGVLGHGCVQEEIRFVICPELMISMLFTEMLQPDEALIVIGCERYSNYSGYGNSFEFAGDHRDATPYDSSGRRRCAVLAVDAMPFGRKLVEFQPEKISRELLKVWVGVSFDTEADPTCTQYPGVATGNWGCGAFGGTPRLKALLQLMACAQARRPMAYFTFGDADLRDDIVDIYNLLTRNNVTVGQLFEYIVRYSEPSDVSRGDLYTFLPQLLQPRAPDPKPQQCSVEAMDISSEEQLITSSIERELLNNSPDLFSQEDHYGGVVVETKAVEPKTVEPTTSDHVADKTKSLFEKMDEFDEQNCKLNLNISRSCVKRESRSADVSMDRADSPKHVKKKANLKITDYFNKSSS